MQIRSLRTIVGDRVRLDEVTASEMLARMLMSRGFAGLTIGLLLAAVACAHMRGGRGPCVAPNCHSCEAHDDCLGKGSNGADWSCNDGRCDYPSRGAVGSGCGAGFDCAEGLACIEKQCAACSTDAQCRPGTCGADQRCEPTPCSGPKDCADDEICSQGTCWILNG
jgi:hypothetical protein